MDFVRLFFLHFKHQIYIKSNSFC